MLRSIQEHLLGEGARISAVRGRLAAALLYFVGSELADTKFAEELGQGERKFWAGVSEALVAVRLQSKGFPKRSIGTGRAFLDARRSPHLDRGCLPWDHGRVTMHEALRALNQIVSDRVIETYAIAGAVGAAFYIEASQTEDVDVFVYLQPGPSGLVTLEPIFDALTKLGGISKDGYIHFGDWPIQILSDATPLIAEAIEQAVDVPFDDIPTRVFTAEHLCAVALEAGRPKDYLRVTMFLDQNEVDRGALRELAKQHGLLDKLARVLPETGGNSI